MLIKTERLLSHQGEITREIVDSIVRGIKAGDDIPSIKLVSIEDLIRKIESKFRRRLVNLKGNYVVFDGTHRAKAYDILGLPVRAGINQPPWYAENHMLEEIFRLKKISELEIISDVEEYLEAKESSFYR